MKKQWILIMLCLATTGVMAQKGFMAGVRGAYNATGLLNKNVSDAGDELDYKFSGGFQFGITALYMFDDHFGISVDGLMGTVNQKYTNRIDSGFVSATFESDYQMKTIDIPVLFHYEFGGGAYLEIGPQFSIVNSLDFSTEPFSLDVLGFNLNFPGSTTSQSYYNSYLSGVLGFGYNPSLTDNLKLITGIRLGYGLGDVFDETEYKKEALYQFKTYEPTNVLTAGINLGIAYKFNSK